MSFADSRSDPHQCIIYYVLIVIMLIIMWYAPKGL